MTLMTFYTPVNGPYNKGTSASEKLCLQEVHSDTSLHVALSNKIKAATVLPG